MANGNNVEIVGNATKDPELRFTPGGAAVVSLSIAVNRRWQNKQTQEWEEEVSYFDIVAWNELAENVAATVSKGMRIMVVGRLDQRSWEDKTTGDKRSKVEIVADEIAPSLRYATAEVTKVEKGEGGAKPSGRSKPAFDPDEEPF